MEGVMRAARCLDIRLPPVQVSLNQLFDTFGFGCLVSYMAGKLGILDPEESFGILQIPWATIYLFQTSHTMPAFLRASVKSRPHPSSRLPSHFTAYNKESDTENRYKISLK